MANDRQRTRTYLDCYYICRSCGGPKTLSAIAAAWFWVALRVPILHDATDVVLLNDAESAD